MNKLNKLTGNSWLDPWRVRNQSIKCIKNMKTLPKIPINPPMPNF